MNRRLAVATGLALMVLSSSLLPAYARTGGPVRPGVVPVKPSSVAAAPTGPIQSASGLQNEQLYRKQFQQQYSRDHGDATGKVRSDLWRAGIQAAKHLKVSTSWHGGGPAPGSQNSITSTQWTQIGPAPLRVDDGNNGANKLFQGAGPDSGEVTDIAIDPSGTSDQVIYIATNDGGIWKSITGGSSWMAKTDTQASLSIGAVILDPTNPSIVYAGTGNDFDGGITFSKGVGVYRSTDGGDHWIVVGSSVLTGKNIVRMVMPAPGTLLVATHDPVTGGGGVYRSIDSGAHFGNNSPLFDNGNPVLAGYITDLHLDTGAPTATVYAAVNHSGIYKSTDAGASFPTLLFSTTCLAAPYCFISFTQSTQPDNQTLYASVQTGAVFDPITGKFAYWTGGVFRSLNGGSTWASVFTTPSRSPYYNGCQCGYDQTIGVDPQDANRVYVGWQELWMSTNGGVNFSATPVTLNQVHWDHHALVFSPQSHLGTPPTRFYVGTDGGIATSGDGGTNWSNMNEGISTNLIHVIDIGRGNSTNNGYTYGTAQDTGSSEHRPAFPGADWHLGIDGDGAAVAVDPTNPLHAYSVDNGHFIETSDGGATWPVQDFTDQMVPGAFRFATDPNSGMNVWVGSASGGFAPGSDLYRSTNGGMSFQGVCRFSDSPGVLSQIWWLATTPADSTTLWVGLGSGIVWRTHNAIAGLCPGDWQAFVIPGAPSNARVTGIAIDPIDAHQVVVTYAGFCGGACAAGARTRHVFRTPDDGTTWTDISGTDGGAQNLPDLPVNAAVIDPGTTPHSIIVSDDAGVLRSQDVGATWQILGTGLPTVDSTSLALDSNASPALLRVGTYGRSAFELRSVAQAPGAPTGLSATAGDAKAVITWVAPGSDGGSPITAYRVTPYIGTTAQTATTFNSTATSQTITGLTNGTIYTFKVAAINGIGTGADSTPSNAVTPLPAPFTAASTQQYTLTNSDGTTWVDMDATNLTLTITPTFNAQAILSGNSDLWTANAGYNQDLGIDVNGTIQAWKESGGFAGTFSPNAAFVQTVMPMTASATYVIKLRWKTNKAAAGATIYAGAGSVGHFSPTSLTALLVATGVSTAISNQQYTLPNSDGSTWMDLDAANLKLTLTPSVNSTVILSGNADLWTANAGYNQDLGIDVNGTIQAWKESGGFAGTFSPNAAMVQAALSLTAGTTYVVKLRWKTNKPAPGATIYAGAGTVGHFSPTSVTAQLVASGVSTALSSQQYTLPNSDGSTWMDLDATNLKLTLTPGLNSTVILSGNADLWTANAGYNQDLGIDVNGTIVAWKESGGFAGTFSPNAAMVQAALSLTAGTTYVVKLRWKTNKPAAGTTIYAGAGTVGNFSPTSLTAHVVPS